MPLTQFLLPSEPCPTQLKLQHDILSWWIRQPNFGPSLRQGCTPQFYEHTYSKYWHAVQKEKKCELYVVHLSNLMDKELKWTYSLEVGRGRDLMYCGGESQFGGSPKSTDRYGLKMKCEKLWEEVLLTIVASIEEGSILYLCVHTEDGSISVVNELGVFPLLC